MSTNRRKTQSKPKIQQHSKPKPTQEEIDRNFPRSKYTPMRQLPPGPNGQIRLNYLQKTLTVGQPEPWETKVPPEEYGDYTPEKEDPKPYEQHEID